MRIEILLFFVSIALLGSSCANRHLQRKGLAKYFSPRGLFDDHFTGFALFDPETDKYLFTHQADKYFTPASNTKIFTLYAGLNFLGDSTLTARYVRSQDTLYLWGMGDPTFLDRKFSTSSPLLTLVAQTTADHIYWCRPQAAPSRFGPGWAWDDYPYRYQLERSVLPLFGNQVIVQVDQATQSTSVYPASAELRHQKSSVLRIDRSEFSDTIDFFHPSEPNKSTIMYVPDRNSKASLARHLSKIFEPPLTISQSCPEQKETQDIYTTPIDTVYRRLMHQSDNFIAEQLLLQIGAQKWNSWQTSAIIDSVTHRLLLDLPDQPIWVDGSGLSRYNMFTPRSIVQLLLKIKGQIEEARLFNLFPAGGKSGTIQNFYKNDPAFVFAKTGTLRHNHCLSGYLRTDGGRILIFSFMHNHHVGSVTKIKEGMDTVLRHIKSNY